MKLSEKIWIEKVAQASLTRPSYETRNQYIMQQHMTMFLEELCYLIVNYLNYFNEIVLNSNVCPTELSVWSLFTLDQPRIGLIATRGKDKLVIADEGKSVHIKMSQSYLHNEKRHECLYFDPKASDLGTINWCCANDGQYVNPELVVKIYLSSFFAHGCRGLSPLYPRLVAVGGARQVHK